MNVLELNKESRAHARVALLKYLDERDGKKHRDKYFEPDDFRDFVTDTFHLAESMGFDPEIIAEMALKHWKHETKKED